MPIDFTAYTDPGIYIDLIDPPVNNLNAITPTVIALIGAAGEAGRDVTESTVLRSQYSSTLSAKGIDPFSLAVRNRFTLDQYISAAFGTVTTQALSGATSITVTPKDDFTLPAGVTNADFTNRLKLRIDNQTYSVTDIDLDGNDFIFTVSATSTTIEEGAIVNLFAPYVDPIKVGTFDTAALAAQANLTASKTEFRILQYTNALQRVRITKSGVSGSSDVEVTHNATDNDYDFTVTLVDGGVYKNAAEVLEAILDDSAGLAGYITVTRVEDATNVDYIFGLGFDERVALTDSTDTDSVAVVSSIGLSPGDLLLIDKERVAIDTVVDISTNGDTKIVELTVVRAIDGTVAAPHGKVDVFLSSGYDYFVNSDSGTDGEFNGVDDITILSAVPGGRLAPLDENGSVAVSAESIEVKANSTDAKQHAVEVFTDLDDIRDKYGKPVSSNDPLITSNLTLAAQMAMRNGASRVYCVSVETNDVEGFEDAITKLANVEDINVIVPVTAGLNFAATEQIISSLISFINSQANLGNLLRAFVSVDGNSTVVTASDFAALAQRIANPRVSLVAPSRFGFKTSAGKITAGGPFAAAAVAGLHASFEAQVPLTRKQLDLSLSSIEDPFTGKEMLDLQSKGVLVLNQDRNGRLTIRHGLTTDMTNVYTQEVSVVAARDRLRDLVYTALQTAGILGSPITANTPELVVSNITGALEFAKRATLIFDYADVKYRIPSNNPTAIEVRFAYRPTMPLNYVLVQFSVDTTSSAVTFQSITEGGV